MLPILKFFNLLKNKPPFPDLSESNFLFLKSKTFFFLFFFASQIVTIINDNTSSNENPLMLHYMMNCCTIQLHKEVRFTNCIKFLLYKFYLLFILGLGTNFQSRRLLLNLFHVGVVNQRPLSEAHILRASLVVNNFKLRPRVKRG